MPKAINNSNLIVKTDVTVKFSGKLNHVIISREARTMFLRINDFISLGLVTQPVLSFALGEN